MSNTVNKSTKQNTGVRKRSPNACARCRQQKIRCTGSWPCQPCSKRELPCTFDDSSQKIVVSKGYVRALQEKAAQIHTGPDGSIDIGVTQPDYVHNGREAVQDDVATWLGSVEAGSAAHPDHLAVPGNLNGQTRETSGSPSAQDPQLMNPFAVDASNYVADSSGKPSESTQKYKAATDMICSPSWKVV